MIFGLGSNANFSYIVLVMVHRLKKFHSRFKTFGFVLTTVLGVVLFWRGVWGLMDIYLFPDQPTLSYLLSILGGLLVLWIDDGEIEELVHHS